MTTQLSLVAARARCSCRKGPMVCIGLARALALTSIALVVLALLLAPAQDRQPIPQFLIGRGGNALFTAAWPSLDC